MKVQDCKLSCSAGVHTFLQVLNNWSVHFYGVTCSGLNFVFDCCRRIFYFLICNKLHASIWKHMLNPVSELIPIFSDCTWAFSILFLYLKVQASETTWSPGGRTGWGYWTIITKCYISNSIIYFCILKWFYILRVDSLDNACLKCICVTHLQLSIWNLIKEWIVCDTMCNVLNTVDIHFHRCAFNWTSKLIQLKVS